MRTDEDLLSTACTNDCILHQEVGILLYIRHRGPKEGANDAFPTTLRPSCSLSGAWPRASHNWEIRILQKLICLTFREAVWQRRDCPYMC